MSKNITIQEGGVAKQLTVDKLKTNLAGGGACLWVPEDNTHLGTKHISENGTYKASDDGYYGYSEVTVNGVGSVTGRDPDTGEEVEVHRDPTTGEIVETVIPVEINVIEPPTNPYGIYVDGQTITKDGMVVKAYGANGDELQVVPISEITLNPDRAVYDESKDRPAHGTATSDLDTGLVQPIAYAKTVTSNNSTLEPPFMEWVSAEACAGYINTPDTVAVLFASSHQPAAHRTSNRGLDIDVNGDSYTYDGKTVYYGMLLFSINGEWQCDAPINATTKSPGTNDAWTMIYGERHEERAGSPQTITVSWPRPGDGQVLATSFDILVAPPYSSGED